MRGNDFIARGYRAADVTNCFDGVGDTAFLLKRMAGRQAERSETPARRAAGNPKLPGNRDYWPDKTHLALHRKERLFLPADTKEAWLL